MAKKSDTRRFTAEELAAMQHRESRTDWAKVGATTEAQLEASIEADRDEAPEADWTRAVVGIPPRKQDIHIRLDADVLDWFKETGKGYQTRINSVLRAFIESRKHTSG